MSPVQVDSEGLMAALAELAEHTRKESNLDCKFDCPHVVSVEDNLTAAHLYLIAQESVHNVIKHARARKIRISLVADGGLVLSIRDDGIGIPSPRPERNGLGLRIMRNRAAIVGATLTVKPAKPRGTIITCVLPRKNNEPR
jgi:signal transduction histidine kinase